MATEKHKPRSTSTYPLLPSTTHSRGRERITGQWASNWTSYTHGAGITYLDSRQQPRSSGSAVITNLCHSAYSYLRMGESLRVQQQWYDVKTVTNQTKKQVATRSSRRTAPSDQRHHPSGAAVQGTHQYSYRRLGTSWR